jgi:hypothetical protein
MTLRRFVVPVTTIADGSATKYSAKISGKLEHIAYVKTDFADGSTFTITNETSGENLLTETAINASAVRRPRAPTHSQAGVASLYAGAGTAVNDRIAIANARIKIVIAGGGATKTGAFHFVVDD